MRGFCEKGVLFVSETSKPVQKQASKSKSRIWFMASVVLSLGIIAWSFTLPFRAGGSLRMDSGKRTGGSISVGGEGSSDFSSDAKEFRAAAIAMDQEFMRARREKSRLKTVPGRTEVRRAWNRRVERVRREVKGLGNPEQGTVQWQERQELISLLDDAPL